MTTSPPPRPAKSPLGWLRVPDLDWPLVHAWEKPCGGIVRFWAGVVPVIAVVLQDQTAQDKNASAAE